nr:sulfatase-like hydrolase/transferase [Caulobacter soli]
MPNGKPNILFIMADDIGWFNVSAYNLGLMGYRTPNIDSIARDGALFTDFYGQQSCTAGRAAFITGQSPIRTGLTKVGMPATAQGLSFEDPSVGQFLKSFGYATGQFGKNHLGDRNEHLPTVHGFDEFFGNLYHLNAEEEPYYENYPKDPAFRAKYGPRGVLKCKATDAEDATVDPHFGKVGKQTIENTGPLPKERMETVDEEFLEAALDFIDRKTTENQPWFCYFNPTRMHVFTHLKPASKGKTGLGVYPDGMVELDGYVGQLLDKLKALGISDDTVVVFTTDNGAEVLTWARRRRHAVPGREGHQLGRRLARALRDPLARRGREGPDHQRHRLAAGLHPHLRGRQRRARPRGEGQEGLRDRRQDLQGPPRWVEPAAFPQGRGGGIAAQGLHLLERRRRMHGPAHGPLQDRLRRAA